MFVLTVVNGVSGLFDSKLVRNISKPYAHLNVNNSHLLAINLFKPFFFFFAAEMFYYQLNPLSVWTKLSYFFDEFILVSDKAKSTDIAIAMASIFNAVWYQKKPSQSVKLILSNHLLAR